MVTPPHTPVPFAPELETAYLHSPARIEAAVLANPATEITVDLGAHVIRFGSETAKLTMRETARDALVNGRWDSIGELLEGREAVIATASKLPYLAAPQK